jgi:hypothetical protein
MNRLTLTNDEKLAHEIMGDDSDYTRFNMNEQSIDKMIQDEKKRKFNDEVKQHEEELEKQKKAIEEYQESIKENANLFEIKPLYNRIIVKPFAYNPFQQIKIENGIITDIGGMNPNTEFNPNTGQFEEREQNIIVATVVEVGPDCKFLQPGDAVFYMRNLPTPIPFFKQGLWTLKEENVIAVVNEGLEERFKK